MTGKERRRIYPAHGLMKLTERWADRFASRDIFPYLWGIERPYSRLLPRRIGLGEADLAPPLWPTGTAPLRVLLLSDVHTGPFLQPPVLGAVLDSLMTLEPDLVAIAGDMVTGDPTDLDPFLAELETLAAAPLGAWFCLGNHDHFTREPESVTARLESVGIQTLRNEVVTVRHDGAAIRIGGIDDRLLGMPDWDGLCREATPDCLLAHNPDDFHEAVKRRVPLVLSGHTHGGQIRFPGGPPIIRQSRYRLDEGLYAIGDSQLVVSRGLGAVGLPWRFGADPEAVWLEIQPAS